jgi:flagellar basal body-associated protein FliL
MEGKKKLAAEILAETRSSLPAGGPIQTPDQGVQNVLFSSMIVQ